MRIVRNVSKLQSCVFRLLILIVFFVVVFCLFCAWDLPGPLKSRWQLSCPEHLVGATAQKGGK